MPKNYISIDETEMEYVDGGGVVTKYANLYASESLRKALFCASVSTAIGVVTSEICAALGVSV